MIKHFSIFEIRNGIYLNGEMMYSSIISSMGMIFFAFSLGIYFIVKVSQVGDIIGFNKYTQKYDQKMLDDFSPKAPLLDDF